MRLLSAPFVLTMTGELIRMGALLIDQQDIIDIGTEKELLKRYPHASYEYFPEHVLMPGLINSHTHFDMSLYRDFENDPVRSQHAHKNFINWLMGCLEYKRRADHTQLRHAVEWALDCSIHAGTTCIADMGNYEGIFSLLEQKGMRAVIFPEVMSFDNQVSKDLFESALAIVEKYQEDELELINVGMGPYSPYLLSRNILKIMSIYCRSSRMPLMIHVASSFPEMEFFHNSTGDIGTKLFPNIGWEELPPAHQRTPVQHLHHIGFLDSQPLLVGCVQLTDDDLRVIAKSGSKIVLTPRAGENLEQGHADYERIKEFGITTCLGTDGIPSVQSLSLWDELRAFLSHQKDASLFSGEEILRLVTRDAAKALDMESLTGTLSVGKSADLIAVHVGETIVQNPPQDIAKFLIENTRESHVHKVWIHGRVVKELM